MSEPQAPYEPEPAAADMMRHGVAVDRLTRKVDAAQDLLNPSLEQRYACALLKRITSLQASLDDMQREIERLTGEKRKRDVTLRQVADLVASVVQPEEPQP